MLLQELLLKILSLKKDKNIYYYKMGYKNVPKKIKGSGLEVKKLYEGEFNEFQKGRIDIFEKNRK